MYNKKTPSKIKDIAYTNNKTNYTMGWWTRTMNIEAKSTTYVIGPTNCIDFTNAYDESGIRPAFCISSETQIIQSNNIIKGQNVFCIK